jgi:L-threonylcarbamoyladenylate synthase
VADDLGDAVDTILDGGACAIGIESTIVAFTDDHPVLLRPGGIGVSALSRVLGLPLANADASAPRASGTLPSHYAPKTPAHVVAADFLRPEISQLDDRDEIVAVLARTVARPADFAGVWLAAPADAAQYAHDLYSNLRTLDAANADVILIEAVPEGDAWLAVTDRLSRATRGVDDDRD